jgi:hypothetical protein
VRTCAPILAPASRPPSNSPETDGRIVLTVRPRTERPDARCQTTRVRRFPGETAAATQMQHSRPRGAGGHAPPLGRIRQPTRPEGSPTVRDGVPPASLGVSQSALGPATGSPIPSSPLDGRPNPRLRRRVCLLAGTPAASSLRVSWTDQPSAVASDRPDAACAGIRDNERLRKGARHDRFRRQALVRPHWSARSLCQASDHPRPGPLRCPNAPVGADCPDCRRSPYAQVGGPAGASALACRPRRTRQLSELA